MSKLTIDFGTTRTKVAAFNAEKNEPYLIELGRAIRTIIPSTFHIPKEGDILVGDDAEDAISVNPAGIVRGLKKELHKEGKIRRNKRKLDRIDLASKLFKYIKEECEEKVFHGQKITDCSFSRSHVKRGNE